MRIFLDTARYKAFLVAAETRSFTKAAELLCYTPSGISQLKMLPAIRALLKQEENIYQLAAELNGLQTGTVTIATYLSIATY